MAVPIDTRSGAQTYELEDVVALARRGRLRVPHFQRGLKWSQRDALKLLDSIVKGYPVGSLLLWDRPAEKEEISLGALRIDAPATEHALWVVDGQQRVTTLVNVFSADAQQDERFALSFDLVEERVVPSRPKHDVTTVPLWVLFDLEHVLNWFADNPDLADFREKAFALAKHLRQYDIPAYRVVHSDVRTLQEIFDRMNNAGVRLSRAEVFSALNAGDEADAGNRFGIEQIAERIDVQLNFGRIDDDTVLQCLLARRGPDTQREIRREFAEERHDRVDFPGEDRAEAFQRGGEALARAVRFVIDAGVPHFAVLPYRYLLVVLTRFLALYPDPTPREALLLRRWFWRAAVTGPVFAKGSTTGATRTLCGRISRSSALLSLEGLLKTMEKAPLVSIEPSDFRTNEAESKIVFCSWWSRGPRSPFTGTPYERSDLYTALKDSSTSTAAEVVPLIFRRDPAVPLTSSAANRLIVLEPGEGSRSTSSGLFDRTPLTIESRVWDEVLESHLIAREALDPLMRGDVQTFLARRNVLVRQQLKQFLDKSRGADFEDTPDLDDLDLDDWHEVDGSH